MQQIICLFEFLLNYFKQTKTMIIYDALSLKNFALCWYIERLDFIILIFTSFLINNY